MPDRNSVTWTCLVSGYAQHGEAKEAIRIFKGMICAGFSPSHYAFGSALRACQEFGSDGVKFGMQVHGLVMKSQYGNDAVVCNVLISMYGSFVGYADYALRVFDEMEIRNSASWNSVISVFSKKGEAVSVFELFSGMHTEDFLKPNEYTFGSLISVACDYGLSLLVQMLAMVQKSGFLTDLYVGSALVSGFARNGSIDLARKIFQQLSQKNVVSMNGLMVGLVRQKLGVQATEVFMETRNLVGVNMDSYLILLSAFAEYLEIQKGKRKGKEVHGFLIRSNLNNINIAIGNGLINMYAKCASIHEAISVFNMMIDKDSVTWNSMISGLDQNDRFEDAAINFREMKRIGLVPSNFTLISSLSSSASLGWVMLGKQIHGEGIKLGLDTDVSVSNALLGLYAEVGFHPECKKVFSFMADLDNISWNSIIGGLADSETSASEAIDYFLRMMKTGWSPNKITFINILRAISSLSLAHPAHLTHQIHSLLLKCDVSEDIAIENALLACYGKSRELRECEKIFSKMSDRKDEVSYNSMISSYIHNELLTEAMDLVWSMMQTGKRLDSFTFATVLSACASVATLERGMEVHACSVRSYLDFDIVVGSALIDMYAKCGQINYASKFFNMMPIKNVYSWNSMISGYARHGYGDRALKIFAEMNCSGPPPDHVTFVGVLSACSHVGLVDEGFRHFESMSDVYGLTPKMEHYSCVVDLLGRAGRLDEIEDFINRMSLQPNVLLWRTVLGACCRANGRNSDLGRKAAEMLLEFEPQNAVNYVLLSNMYASGEKWEEMAKARKAMQEAAVKKEVGCSWVTMKDGVHSFIAGDKTHLDKDLIYEKLKELNKKIRDIGYVPQTNYTMYDLEPESKEELLSYHSEKLAVAFVLSRKKSSMPIRIIKNLRVCGDCHSAFKYISKVVGRQIILRDSNRFHHFMEGHCSCGDYW
ncbi:hypothetical protein ACFE04_002020 [Oxalis oulophora]